MHRRPHGETDGRKDKELEEKNTGSKAKRADGGAKCWRDARTEAQTDEWMARWTNK